MIGLISWLVGEIACLQQLSGKSTCLQRNIVSFGKHEAMWRRVLAGLLGTLAVLAGYIAYGYASMNSEDFRNPNVSFWSAALGTGFMWLLTLGAFGMGIHFLKYSFTGEFFRVNLRLRALILGALSFFPGFFLLAAPALFLVSKRWPRDTHADDLALLISAFLGVALAVVVCLALLRRAQRNDAAAASVK